jgi:hypothetical protein
MATEMSKDLIYLSNKRTALSNPGVKMDDIYYSQLNSTVELSECTYNLGRFTTSLSQLTFGSTSQVIIPNSSLVQGVYLILEAPPVVLNQTLPLGWGYSMISNVSYLFGSSNVSQLNIPQQALIQTLMMECETAEKRTEFLRVGGEEITTNTATSVFAYIFIPLPFSSACGIKGKLPFDTSILDNPIVLQISISRADQVYGGSGVFPQALLRATCVLRQGDLSNKDQSLRPVLMKNPELMYSYPFIHRQLTASNVFQGSTNPSAPVTLALTSFINADLVAISLVVIPQSKLSNNGASCPNQIAYDRIQNINLTFNGLTMFSSTAELYRLTNMLSTAGGGYFHNSIINDSGVAPFASVPYDAYIPFIDFSRIRSACFDGSYQNVWRIGNNTLSLTFTTTTTANYQLYAIYHYNGVAEVQNGQTRIYFD